MNAIEKRQQVSLILKWSGSAFYPLPPGPSPPNLPLSETRDLLNDAGMKGNIRAY